MNSLIVFRPIGLDPTMCAENSLSLSLSEKKPPSTCVAQMTFRRNAQFKRKLPLVALIILCGSLMLSIDAQSLLNCDLDITNPELADEPTLCEQITDFDVTPVEIGEPAEFEYWSTSGLGFPTLYGVANQDILIQGTLIIDEPAGFWNCRIKMGANAKIVILEDEYLLSLGSKWFSCSTMWTGIEINSQGTLSAFGSEFEDAVYLITADDGAKLTLLSNQINRNYIGIRNGVSSSEFTGIAVAFMANNTFSCTAELNNTLAFVPPISYAGIYLDKGTLVVGGNGYFSYPNYFNSMRNGIVLRSSTAQITNMHFSNMIENGGADFSGHGIAVQDGILRINAEEISGRLYGRSTFHNCVSVPIFARSSNIDVTGAIFTGLMAGAIECDENSESQFVSIKKCRFEIDDPQTVGAMQIVRGTGSGANPHYVVANDTINIADNFPSPAFGINFGNSFYPAIDDAFIQGNSFKLTTDEGLTAISVFNWHSDGYKILNNRIKSFSTTEGSPLQRLAIACLTVLTGKGNEISENQITGVAVTNSLEAGIWLGNFANTQVCNNIIDYTERGIHILGNNAPFELTANDINRHEWGLLIEDASTTALNGMIGLQTRRGNVWGSSGDYTDFAAQCTANPNLSLFEVTSTPPTPRDPGGSDWFQLVAGDDNECGENSNLDLLTTGDTLIIEDELFDNNWTDAYAWSEEKKLMLKLIRNPSLRTTGSIGEDYYLENITESFGLHAQAESDYMDAMLSPSGHALADASVPVIHAWLDSMALLQDAAFTGDTLTPDATLMTHTVRLINELQTEMESYYETVAEIEDDQETNLSALISSVNSLPASESYERFSRRILQISITSVINDSISDAHLLALDSIASASLDTGGLAVTMARGLLGPCSGYDVFALSDPPSEAAFPVNVEDETAESSLEMHARYNCDGHEISIDWNIPASGRVRIVNSIGQEIMQMPVIDAMTLRIEIKESAGLYYVYYEDKNGLKLTKPIVIAF